MDMSSDLDGVYFDCNGDEVLALSSADGDDDSEAEDDEEAPRLNSRSRVDATKIARSSLNSRPPNSNTTTMARKMQQEWREDMLDKEKRRVLEG